MWVRNSHAALAATDEIGQPEEVELLDFMGSEELPDQSGAIARRHRHPPP
jgi:hypothetical protein